MLGERHLRAGVPPPRKALLLEAPTSPSSNSLDVAAKSFFCAPRSIVGGDFREQETRGRLREREDLVAAEDGELSLCQASDRRRACRAGYPTLSAELQSSPARLKVILFDKGRLTLRGLSQVSIRQFVGVPGVGPATVYRLRKVLQRHGLDFKK